MGAFFAEEPIHPASRDFRVTNVERPAMNCVVCAAQLPQPAAVGRPRRYCSTACRQRAYRQRQRSEQRFCLPPRRLPGAGAPMPAEPLLAAIVLVPLDDAESVYAAQGYVEFPWESFLAGLRAERNAADGADSSASSQREYIDPDARQETKTERNLNEIQRLRDEIMC